MPTSLEALTGAEKRAEKPPLPATYKANQTYTPGRNIELGKLPPAEAAHRAREMRAEMRNDPQPAAPGLFLLAAAAFFANLVILAIGKLADFFCQFAA